MGCCQVLDESELKDMIKEVVGGKKTIDFDAFYSLVAQLDELVEGEEDGEDGESYDDDDEDDDDDEGEELAEAEMRAFAEELYDGLRGEDAALTVAKFKKWSEVDDLIGDKIITEADLNKLIKESGSNGKLLTFEQFYDVMSVLETAGEEEGEEDEGFEILDSTKGFSKGAASGGGDEGDEEDDDGFDELSSEEVDELLTSFYDELKGPNGKVRTPPPRPRAHPFSATTHRPYPCSFFHARAVAVKTGVPRGLFEVGGGARDAQQRRRGAERRGRVPGGRRREEGRRPELRAVQGGRDGAGRARGGPGASRRDLFAMGPFLLTPPRLPLVHSLFSSDADVSCLSACAFRRARRTTTRWTTWKTWTATART
jgi:hypothetical protein